MRIALMMPGQGSQAVGMGRDLADAHPSVREIFARADDVLGVPLSRLCFDGPEGELTRTENAQPAILLHSWAAWTRLSAGLRGAVVTGAGHSLGEFSAYLAAGALRFEDALRIVRRRGELMAASGDERPGTMAAILGLDPEAVRGLCAEVSEGPGVVVPANFNAPDQIVVSGDVGAVEEACRAALAAGARRAVPLNVSGAFHSPLMESAREGLAAALDAVEISDPAFPVVANATASPVRTAAEVRERLVRQLTSPVRWVESVEAMGAFEPDVWLELGPGRVLSGLLRRIDRALPVRAAADAEELTALEEALNV